MQGKIKKPGLAATSTRAEKKVAFSNYDQDHIIKPRLAVDNSWIGQLYILATKYSYTGIRADQLHYFDQNQLWGMYLHLRRIDEQHG